VTIIRCVQPTEISVLH